MNWSGSRRPRRAGTYARRRNRRNWLPFILFILVVGFFLGVLVLLFANLFSNVRQETVSATITEIQGQAEFLLAENEEEWSRAFADLSFVEGDSIRTSGGSKMTLSFLENNAITLDENTEMKITKMSQNSSGRKQVSFTLVQGRAWSYVEDSDFQSHDDSLLTIDTERLKLNVRGTAFDLSTTLSSDIVRLFSGKVDIDVFGPDEDSKPQNVTVGVGQQIEIKENTYDLLVQKADLLESLDRDFEESTWHVDNLNRFFPEKAQEIQNRLEAQELLEQAKIEVGTGLEPLADNDPAAELTETASLTAPTVTSHTNGQVISSTVDQIFIKGTAPTDAFQIQVNDFALERFEPGNATWQYIASLEFKTLKPGLNTYKIFAISRNGQRSPVTTLTLNYAGSGTPTSVAPAPVVAEVVTPAAQKPAPAVTGPGDFAVPVVTTPEVFSVDPNATYETAQSPFTFFGKVSDQTQAVEINDFRLKLFKPGDTEFKYIANAVGGNMNVGENTYVIKAFGPNGTTSQTQIKIVYTPITVVE